MKYFFIGIIHVEYLKIKYFGDIKSSGTGVLIPYRKLEETFRFRRR
jgi:hypothetical protein